MFLKDKNNDILIDFQELLGEGYKFYYSTQISKPEFTVYQSEKEVSIGPIENGRDIIMFFHELGHTHHQANLVRDLIGLSHRLAMAKDQLLTVKDTLLREPDNKIQRRYEAELDKEFKQLLQDEIELRAKVERDAWAWALKTIRQIRDQKGINLLSAFKSFEEVEQYVHYALGTYERDALSASEGRIRNFFTYKDIRKRPY